MLLHDAFGLNYKKGATTGLRGVSGLMGWGGMLLHMG